MTDLDQLALDPTNPAAVEQLLRHARAHATTIIRSRLRRHPYLVEDVVQDTVIATWTCLPRWRPDRPFLALVTRIAVNMSVNALRALRPTVPLESVDFGLLADDAPDLADIAAVSDMYARAQVAMQTQLSDVDHRLLRLRFLHALSSVEAAHVLGLTHGAARLRQHRALKKVAAHVH
ncbi:RNA polymerase sigma factor [Sphaerisporangium aureirubrum]|uniref:RNA polymerase sigma factor n=1 Tax=Sphaerisporangium aureirubrum TaxID=1544736 RepID=A0ABW1NCM3_9ACTN